ncbi:hypothetical protein GCM10023232_28210 [Sphingosinicella ginsenosidimutans]|uniref:Uncharacterized protein n=1 Tax=Allosphingosinicella ginsenosidimutans TaxID=1176539 RepID=A0A5C6TTX6_9SPHN|nr:hypothetical protein [Sphingosinicella ginsenosidimutans]TXC63158.1 hypothetical protein FRZ32_05485 [Sphingosinicella ginsenosidimutans]
MHLDQNVKLLLGAVFAAVGLVILVLDRGSRGFGQRRQAGVLFLIGGAVIAADALGYIHLSHG